MQRLVVLNVVGLSRELLGAGTPQMKKFSDQRRVQSFEPSFPAVTCTAQSSFLTGLPPSEHGVVGNGWYHRELAEVQFWKQPNQIVKGEKLWETLRKRHGSSFTCAKLFWWYNMYSTADYSITPRPMYPADGRKVFDIYSYPLNIRDEIKKDLGEFPFMNFWGPKAGIASSEWIAKSARWIEERYEPTLNLVYLPHLDYPLQKFGPNAPEIEQDLRSIDKVVGDLIKYFAKRGVEVMLLSEYGITPVRQAICPNRMLRRKGWLTIKNELGLEQLDCGASRAFAVADHQVAHIYVNDPSIRDEVQQLFASREGIETVMPAEDWCPSGVARERAGDFIAIADKDTWFAYYYWLDNKVAPDFARTVDIHRKPGYDPVELFIDPSIRYPKLKLAKFLLGKKLGFRGLLDVIPLTPELVKGSHGHPHPPSGDCPLIVGPSQTPNVENATDVHSAILNFFD